MPRRMACSLTIDAVRDRTKTVTRRELGTWRNLHAGDQLTLVEQAMGLPKGAHQVVLADVEVVSVSDVALWPIDQAEVNAEGFPDMTPEQFVQFWLCGHPGYGRYASRWQAWCATRSDDEVEPMYVRRIEWRYI